MSNYRDGAKKGAAPAGVLALDVGNTTTRLGFFAAGELAGTWELTTPARLTADEAFAQAKQALAMLELEAPADSIMACVVPSHAVPWGEALARLCGARPLTVGPGLKTGLRMRFGDPAQVGADRIADAVAACERYGAPVVVVDLGTTTNFEVVDAEGTFVGGIIAPGMGLGAQALTRGTAKLPMVELRAPATVIGKSTDAAMRSGIVLGEVARIEGLLAMISRELGREAPVVLTGDAARAMSALLSCEVAVDDTLTLRGLHSIWRRNR